MRTLSRSLMHYITSTIILRLSRRGELKHNAATGSKAEKRIYDSIFEVLSDCPFSYRYQVIVSLKEALAMIDRFYPESQRSLVDANRIHDMKQTLDWLVLPRTPKTFKDEE